MKNVIAKIMSIPAAVALIGGSVYAADTYRNLTDGQAVGYVMLCSMIAVAILGLAWNKK
jgi:hypothetical protein